MSISRRGFLKLLGATAVVPFFPNVEPKKTITIVTETAKTVTLPPLGVPADGRVYRKEDYPELFAQMMHTGRKHYHVTIPAVG